MKMYRDFETDEILTEDQLLVEYAELKANGDTEAESFEDYIQNCLEGTLERF